MSQTNGKLIMLIGLAVLAVGAVIYFFGNKLHWLGRLPGDIRIEKENVRFFFPITTMILLSGLLNLILWLIRKLFS